MGIKERQERDREAVSRAILDAARELFVAEGFQNVSIRKIAERIEYSPAAIYGYFPSKSDLWLALVSKDLADDAAAMDQVEATTEGIVDRLLGLSRILFARAEADLGWVQLRADIYAEMLTNKGFAVQMREPALELRATIMKRWMNQAVRNGEIQGLPPETVAAAWIAAHRGLLIHSTANPKTLGWKVAEPALRSMLNGLVAPQSAPAGGQSIATRGKRAPRTSTVVP